MPGIIPIPFNAYSSWLEIAKSAGEQLVIFSPFLDEMVIHLFEECPLPWNRLSLVTQDDWQDFSMQNFNKTVVINQLIENGVDVRYLPRLHAKAIVADWQLAVVGSQNFTYYSQYSYEISFRADKWADDDDEVYEIFDALEEWWEKAGDFEEED